MLGINWIKLIFGYLYFSPIIFQKYKKSGQLEIRLSVLYNKTVCLSIIMVYICCI